MSETATRAILLVGEDNPQSSDPYFSLWNEPDGCAGHRLQSQIMQIPEGWYRALWRTNLCNPSWNKYSAEERTFQLLGASVPWSHLVLLGRRVASAFNLILSSTLPPFGTTTVERWSRTFRVTSLPHPSGRCREWNYSDSYSRTLALLHSIAPEVPWGGVH